MGRSSVDGPALPPSRCQRGGGLYFASFPDRWKNSSPPKLQEERIDWQSEGAHKAYQRLQWQQQNACKGVRVACGRISPTRFAPYYNYFAIQRRGCQSSAVLLLVLSRSTASFGVFSRTRLQRAQRSVAAVHISTTSRAPWCLSVQRRAGPSSVRRHTSGYSA